MAQVMKMKVVDFQELTCACKGGSNGVSAIWKYLVRGSWHRQDNLKRLRWQIAPRVVSNLLTRILHVTYQHPTSFRVEIDPTDARDSSCRRVEKIANAIIFCMGTDEGRRFSRAPKCSMSLSSSSRVGLRSRSRLFDETPRRYGDDEGILHRPLIEWISPSGSGDRENCTQMRQIICHCLRRYLGDKLVGESNDILAADFGTVFVGDIVRLD